MGLDQAGVELIAKGADHYIDDMGRAHDATGRYVKAAQDGSAQLSGSGGGFSMIAMAAANFIGTMTVQAFNAAAQAASDFVGSTLNVAADYESTMNRFGAVTGDAVADAGMSIDDFNALFLDMGAKTQFSAQEAAEAAVNLAKGGIDVATIAAGGLEGAMALAAAGELDLAQAAEITAKQLGVWGDEAGGAGHVADRLAQAANASTVDVDDLAQGLANAGASARGSEVSFDDMVQTMALIAPGFTSGATAGTGYANFLSRMNPISEAAQKAMVELGLATEDGNSLFYDAQGNFIGMRSAAQLLQDSLSGLSAAQKADALQTIFGNDAKAAALKLAEAGAAGFDAMGVAMGNAGTAAEQAAERNKGLNFALESLKGSWETIQIVIGTALLPLLTEFLETAIIPLANGVMAFAQENMPAMTSALETAKGAIAPVLETLSSLGQYFLTVAQDGDTLNDWLTHLPEPIQPIVEAAGELQAAFQESLPMIMTYVEDMKATIERAFEFIAPILGENIQSTLTTATEFWKNHGEEVMAVVNFLFRTIVTIVGGALLLITGLIDVGLKFITGLWEVGSLLLQGDWSEAWDSMRSLGEEMINAIGKIVADIIDLAIRTFSGGTMQLDENWRGTLEGLGTAIKDFQDGFIKTVGDFIQGAVDGAMKAANDFVKVGEAIINGVKQGITNLAASLGNAAAEAALGALNSAKAALGIHSPSTAFEEQVGEESIEGAILGIAGMAGKLASATADVFASAPGVASRSMRASTAVTNYAYAYHAPQYHLAVNAHESTGSVISDFGVMQLMAG